jgi:hypothetical protein
MENSVMRKLIFLFVAYVVLLSLVSNAFAIGYQESRRTTGNDAHVNIDGIVTTTEIWVAWEYKGGETTPWWSYYNITYWDWDDGEWKPIKSGYGKQDDEVIVPIDLPPDTPIETTVRYPDGVRGSIIRET